MSGESWLAFKDSLTHHFWFSRLGIQCFLFFPDDVCFITVLFIFPFSKQSSPLSFFVYDLGCDWGSGAGGGGGAAWFGAAFTFFIFYNLFNFFNILMEALLALARPYGQTRTEELSSWKLLTEGRPIWSPLF